MTERADLFDVLMGIRGDVSESKTLIERVQEEQAKILERVDEIGRGQVRTENAVALLESKREDHTTKIDKLEKDVQAIREWKAGQDGTAKGVATTAKIGWVLFIAIGSAVIGLAGIAVSLFKH